MPPSFIVAPLDRTQAAKAHVRCGVSRIKLNGLQERLNGRLSLTLQVVQGTEGKVRLWVSGIVLHDFVLLVVVLKLREVDYPVGAAIGGFFIDLEHDLIGFESHSAPVTKSRKDLKSMHVSWTVHLKITAVKREHSVEFEALCHDQE